MGLTELTAAAGVDELPRGVPSGEAGSLGMCTVWCVWLIADRRAALDIERWSAFIRVFDYVRNEKSGSSLGSLMVAVFSLVPGERSLWFASPHVPNDKQYSCFELLCVTNNAIFPLVCVKDDAARFRETIDFLYENCEGAFERELAFERASASDRTNAKEYEYEYVKLWDVVGRVVVSTGVFSELYPDVMQLVDFCQGSRWKLAAGVYLAKVLTILAFVTYGSDPASVLQHVAGMMEEFYEAQEGCSVPELEEFAQFEWDSLMDQLWCTVAELDEGGYGWTSSWEQRALPARAPFEEKDRDPELDSWEELRGMCLHEFGDVSTVHHENGGIRMTGGL